MIKLTIIGEKAYVYVMQKTLSVVNLAAIRRNALNIRRRLNGKKFYAVVKANAYGHGAVAVARGIEDIADGFCVAIADEGAELRLGGITKPVLVFSPPLDRYDVLKCAYYGLTVTVNSEETAELIGDVRCHIKVNTGMNRYGCPPDGIDGILSRLDSRQIEGVYSHLYAAEDLTESVRQLEVFERVVKRVKEKNGEAVAHISASGGMLRGGGFLMDGARCGITLYGYVPFGFINVGFVPALKVYARLAQKVKAFGGGVGYNTADKKYENLFTYRLGYADGFDRGISLGEKTLCMDAFISEKYDGGKVKINGEIYEGLYPVFTSAEAYAERCGTISYEVLCSVTRRSEIIYERTAQI